MFLCYIILDCNFNSNLERTPTSYAQCARVTHHCGDCVCLYLYIYFEYILYSTKYTFSRYVQQKVGSCESRGDEELFRQNENLAFLQIFFSIPSSIRAAPVAHPRLPIYSYKSILQYIYRKNICISKPSLIVASFFSATDIR